MMTPTFTRVARSPMNASTPAPASDTRQRIVDAAIRCLQRWGVDKTSLNEIAREAGVTRPTVYSYFPSRDDVIQAALLQSGHAFAERLLRHVDRFNSLDERLVETMLFALRELPLEPQLGLVRGSEFAQFLNTRALTTPEGQEICQSLFRVILKDDPALLPDLAEISEVATRMLLSLLTLEGPVVRDEEQMRQFLRRRLLPALGMRAT